MATVRSAFAILFVFFAACSDDGDPGIDGGLDRDAGSDASIADSGRPGVECGVVTCSGFELCLVEPTGPCRALDAGACPATEEACQDNAISGCTGPRDRTCLTLPASCQNLDRPCPCLIGENLCPAQIGATCQQPPGRGPIAECPF